MTSLRGHRVVLRAVEPEDLDDIFVWENDSASWCEGVVTVPISAYAVRRYVETTQSDVFADGEVRLMIEVEEVSATVGCVDLTHVDVRNGRGEVSVYVAPSWRRRGYAGEALGVLRDYAFDFLRLHQLYASVCVTNEVSVRLFERQGYVSSGVLRAWQHVDGRWTDVLLMQLVNPLQ